MDNKELQKALNKFGKYVIQQSRSNLSKGNKNATKQLYESMGTDLRVMPNSISFLFTMENYGVFQDRGVKGTLSGRSLDSFRYKSSSNVVGMEYHTGTFRKWLALKGIRFRNAKGRFISYEQSGYALAQHIKKHGIKPSMFFTKPFEKAFKDLPEELVETYALSVEKELQNSFKTILKK